MSVGYYEMRKMQAAVILTAATVTMALDNVAHAGAFECEADHQCDGGYCYLETKKCVPCIDCAIYLREASQWRTCARGHQDCGNCQAGFEHEYLTDGTTRSFCVLKKEIENGVLDVKNPYLWTIIASSVIIMALLVYVVLKFYRGFKTRNSLHNSNVDAENPPPPSSTGNETENPPPSYDSFVPLLQRYTDVSPPLVTSLNVVEKGESNLQQAVPFNIPGPPYGMGGDPIDFENEVSDDEPEELHLPSSPLIDSGDENEGPRAISPPQLVDEDTMPSNWMPFAESSQVLEEPPYEEQNSVTSSLSDVSKNEAANVPSESQEVTNDSGVSASCSHQSDLSFANIEMLASGQDTAATSLHSVLQRHRSEEDLSILSKRKRQRRDSGSSSMKSVDAFREQI